MVDILEQLRGRTPATPASRTAEEERRGPREGAGPEDGLWFQILDKGTLRDNWIETSSSGMFVLRHPEGDRLGLVEPRFLPAAERAWKGLQATFERDAAGRPVFHGAVQGMGVQTDAAGYLKIPRLKNSTHGLMAAMIAASEMEAGRATPAASATGPGERFRPKSGGASPENFAARPFERPNGFVIYPEVCAWYGSLTLAN